MTHPPLSNAQIARRKKIQGNISLTTGTLGLTALGLRGAAAAKGVGRVGRTAQRFTKITPDAAKAEKLKDASAAVTTAGAGIGGVGAFNFASYTKAEARKRQPAAVVKGFQMLDFGLSGTTEVSKAMPMPKVPGLKAPMAPLGAKQAFNVKPMAMPKPMGPQQAAAPKTFGQATSTYRQVSPGAPTGKTMPGAQPGRHRAPGGMLSRLSTGQKVAGAGGLGFAGGMGAMAAGRPKRQQFGKAYDEGMNIMEHQRRARDSRRTYNRGQSATGVGGAAITGSALVAASRGEDWGKKVHQASNLVRDTTSFHVGENRMKSAPMRKVARRAMVRGLKGNPAGTLALAGGATMVGGAATMLGARVNEKRHDHAVSQLRRQRMKKSADDLVFKAYDPERSRQRRMDAYQTGATAGAGAMAAGAGVHLRFGAMHARKARAAEKTASNYKTETPHVPPPSGLKSEWEGAANHNFSHAQHNGTKAGLLEHALSSRKTANGHAGKAALFGAGAIGLGVGADRIRSYKRGRGRSYGQLRMINN